MSNFEVWGKYNMLKEEQLFWKEHSYIAKWQNVSYAWTLSFDNQWFIKWWSNRSWHYQPNNEDIEWIIEFKSIFQEKFWIDFPNIQFEKF